ncbi:MAG: class I fructose-bisphosphate aldolase [Alphaproteobacteria bacterium]|jgi:fructose-bisphosphate aldolase class I|tara:strand:- start:42202 stop:43230 length:1029 start_codon:yes stop_codon:yes gene_type:complete
MNKKLNDVAQMMVTPGKGILAADESNATIAKRFNQIDLECSEDNRRNYREMLFRSSDAMKNYISGVILYDETIRQKSETGEYLTAIIQESNSLVGIKVDTGAKPLALDNSQTITEGLDGLRERLNEYYNLGARFAKWRGVIEISKDNPTPYAVKSNAQALARYAALCQEANIVPIIEPEVLMDSKNSIHNIKECERVTTWVLNTVFQELSDADIELEGIILKPNMVIPGKFCKEKSSSDEIAEKTLKCLKETVPHAVPGIAFLSGGQNDIEATRHLSMVNSASNNPWNITFSYGRALQHKSIMTWAGKTENIPGAQNVFSHRAKMNSFASLGKWNFNLENND